MAGLDWLESLDDTRNPNSWITLYHLLILLVYSACQFKMTRLVRNVPIVPPDSVRKTELADASGPRVEEPGTRLLPSNADEHSRRNSVLQSASEPGSHYSHSAFIQGVLLYCLQLLLAHRLGILIYGQVQEHPGFSAILLGLLGMASTTMLLLATSMYLGNARFLTLRGYRKSDEPKLISDPSDPWERSLAFSLFSLAVPWLRLLFACFYAWWSVGEESGRHSK